MISAFGNDPDMSRLGPELERENSRDALEALGHLASSQERDTDQVLRDLIDELNRRA